MIRYHASWVLPIGEPPIRDGWIDVDRGRIAAVGRRPSADAAVRTVDLGDVAVLPGLVNAHTHLELSYMRGQVPPASEFVDWIRGVIGMRRQRPDPAGEEILSSVQAGIAEAVASGTTLVGDISNTLVTYEPLARSVLGGVVFYELIRFSAPEPAAIVERALRDIEALTPADGVRASLAAHAPYSVAPLLFRAIHAAAGRHPFVPWSVHLSESEAEVEFIATGGGAWRRLLEDIGTWDPAWVAPGVSPVQYLDAAGVLDARTVAVHGVQMRDADLALLAARGATLVTCPRSNAHTGAGVPPVSSFYRSGVRVAVGTDSLASTADLNLFTELAAMRRIAPDVPASALLDSATRCGAEALGFEADYGTIEPGKLARLIAVRVPSGVQDIEEFLVGGIEPEQITWVD